MTDRSHPSQRESASCWWPGCAESATTFVTANDVTRDYCSAHAQHVERYYAAAARWEEKESRRV